MNPEKIKVAAQTLSFRHATDEALKNAARSEMRTWIRRILRDNAKRLNNPVLCEVVEIAMDNLEPKIEREKLKEWPISRFEQTQAILVNTLMEIRDNPCLSSDGNSLRAKTALEQSGF